MHRHKRRFHKKLMKKIECMLCLQQLSDKPSFKKYAERFHDGKADSMVIWIGEKCRYSQKNNLTHPKCFF